MNKNLSGIFVESLGKRKTMITARTCDQGVKKQSKINYDTYKQKETEDGGDPVSISSFSKRELTFTRTLHVGFTECQISQAFMFKTYHIILQQFVQTNSSNDYMYTD